MSNLYKLLHKHTGDFYLADDLIREIAVNENLSFSFDIRSKYLLTRPELEKRIKKRIAKTEGNYGYEFLTGNLDFPTKSEDGKNFNCSVRLYPIQLHGYFPQDLPLDNPNIEGCFSIEEYSLDELETG